MKNELWQYYAEPSVFRVGVRTRITVTALDSRYAFSDDGAYTVRFMPLTRNTIRFDTEAVTVKAEASDGKLTCYYTFDREEEYFLRVFSGDTRICQLSVYALEGDLYAMRPLKGDTHVHSCRSDGKETPAVVAASYREAGFDFMALTDHHRYEPSLEAIDAYRDIPLGMTQMTGEEVHSPDTYLHIVHLGGDYSVNEIFRSDKDAFLRDVAYIDRTAKIPLTDEKDRFVYASALWCAGQIKRAGGLSIFPHPFWIWDVYNVPDAVSEALFMNDVFDAFELIGGQSAHENNLQTQYYYHIRELYREKRGKRLTIPVLGASDSHGTINSGWFNRKYSIVFAASRKKEDIMDAIRAGRSAAVERYEDSGNFGVYGELRYMRYARFLCENYFPRTQRLCMIEGQLMREYLLGAEGAADLLAARAHTVDRFADRYFGR